MLSFPDFFWVRFADIKYTQGGFEHMELAKSYYSQAAKLNPDNMRALYGLLLVSSTTNVTPDMVKVIGHIKQFRRDG